MPGVMIPTSNFPVSATELLLDAQSFPPNWQADPCTKSPRCSSQTNPHRSFGIVGVPGHVIQEVTRFGSVEAAHAEF